SAAGERSQVPRRGTILLAAGETHGSGLYHYPISLPVCVQLFRSYNEEADGGGARSSFPSHLTQRGSEHAFSVAKSLLVSYRAAAECASGATGVVGHNQTLHERRQLPDGFQLRSSRRPRALLQR